MRNSQESIIHKKVLTKLIHLIVNFLLTEGDIIQKLLRVSHQSFFEIFSQIFENHELRGMLLDPSKTVLLDFKVADPLEFILKIEKSTEAIEGVISEGNIKHGYSKFVARVSAQPGISISRELCVSTAKKLSMVTQDEESGLADKRDVVLSLILNMLKNCPNLEDKQINDLINNFSSRAFPEILIYLREIKGDYIKCFETYLSVKNPQVTLKVFPWLNEFHEKIQSKPEIYSNLKLSILDKLEVLLAMSLKQTTDMLEIWFKDQQDEIIKKLERRPKLQLDYLSSFLKEKSSYIDELSRDPTLAGTRSEENMRFQSLLQLHIKLLCDIKPEEVVSVLKYKYYPNEACLKICTKKRNKPAMAYLNKKLGDYAQSLNIFIDLLKDHEEKLMDINNIKNIDMQRNAYEKDCLLTKKICDKNAKVAAKEDGGKALYFIFLDHLYEILQRVYDIKNSKAGSEDITEWHTKTTESLNFVIKELLDSMKVSISFSEILKRVTAKYGELEIESFKRMFTSMLFGYFYQEKILGTVINILGHNIVTQFLDLTRSRSKGFKVGNSLCAKCSRLINPKSDAEVVTFFCGHVYHSECVQSRSICYYCTYKDVKAFNIDQLMKKISKKEDKLDLLREEKKEKIEEEEKEEIQNEKPALQMRGRKEEYLKRMKIFEKVRVKSFAMSQEEPKKEKAGHH